MDMSSIVVNVSPDKVLEAVSDLTRHANWAVANISIIAEQESPPADATPIQQVKQAANWTGLPSLV